MAYVEPTDRAKGDFITAAIWNVNVDNMIDTHTVITSGVSLGKTGTQALAVATPITWQTEFVDNGGYYDAGATNRITVPYTGMYLIFTYIEVDSSTVIAFYKNLSLMYNIGTANTILAYSTIIELAANDVFQIRGRTAGVTAQATCLLSAKLLAKW